MSIATKSFGTVSDGREMTLYTLKNASGASVSVTDFGAHLVSVVVPDCKGQMKDVVLGFESAKEYEEKPGSLGATIGRYGNRIGNSRFTLNGKEYALFANNGKNSLHGGKTGFDKKVFSAETKEAEDRDEITFTYVSPDGEENYPGTLTFSVTYVWDNHNTLTLHYTAVSDQDTVVNPTNHAYFNLHGQGEGTILDHQLTLSAREMTEVDEGLIPTGNFVPLENTPLDFTAPRAIQTALDQQDRCAPVKMVNGLDFNFCAAGEGLHQCAQLYDKESGRMITVSTTEPGIQIYTGQGLHTEGKGARYAAFAGVAMETQHYPDSPNHPNFPTTTLKKGETFTSTTVYAFSVK